MQLELLSESDTVTCGNPCPEELCRIHDFAEEGNEYEPILVRLVARGLMIRLECETAIHYRNTVVGDLVLRVVRGLGDDGVSKIP